MTEMAEGLSSCTITIPLSLPGSEQVRFAADLVSRMIKRNNPDTDGATLVHHKVEERDGEEVRVLGYKLIKDKWISSTSSIKSPYVGVGMRRRAYP